jgi:hypothetical protein
MSATVSKAMSAFSAELIRACASKYGFDGEEAMRELSVSFAPSEKKSKGKKEAGPKAASRNQPSIPLPFTGVVREDCCIGVKQNHGLYTQCFSAPGESGLCKGCTKQASKNASGEPDCGVISKRVMQGSEYRDAKGRGPVHYTKVMKKQKLTEEQVQTEAAKFGIEINASHFAVPDAQQKRGRPKKATTSDTESESSSAAGTSNEKKTRGRPKKAAKVVEVNETEDLFASLMQQAQSASPRPSKEQAQEEVQEDDASSISASDSESDSESKGSKKKAKKTKEVSEEELAEKAAKFLAKEEAKEKKALAQQEKAAEKEQAQQEKVKKAAEKEQAQQEKALKLAEKEAEKALKLAEKEAEKALKLAEKEQAQQEKAKKLAEKPKKAEKTEKKTKKTKKAEEPAKPQAKAEEPVADLESEDEESDTEEPVVTVKKFEHQGVTYLKSSDGILYDAKSQEVVGKWNEKAGMIDVYNGDSEEEESDEDDE